ncbi:MAG: hypothetical protein KAG96_07800 [Ichthyobacteriaceae bacterium]|nr:hypothetical protein [Ichthyobacteriaceae bacterium]
MSTKILFLFVFILLGHIGFAQVDRTWRYTYPEFNEEAEGNLYFRLENNNFVRNTEYFGNYIEGYTMMGYTAQPSLMYYASPRVRFKAGVQVMRYFGVNTIKEVEPVLSIHAKLTDNLDLIMGSLKGNVQHRMIEPVFNPENQYTRQVENGFQFLYDNNKLWLDIWVDWEQFIFKGDEKPEKFTAGISADYKFNKSENDWQFSVPFQMIATHVGGQISDYPERMQSIVNLASGVKVKRNIDSDLIKSVGLSSYYVTYKDLTKSSGLEFNSGNAIYPVAEVDYKYGVFMVGYWYADDFVAPRGNYIFQSVSNYKNDFYTKHRSIITSKFSYAYNIMKQVKFSAMVETYYDIPAKQFDYAYGINIVFTPNFFITKLVVD